MATLVYQRVSFIVLDHVPTIRIVGRPGENAHPQIERIPMRGGFMGIP